MNEVDDKSSRISCPPIPDIPEFSSDTSQSTSDDSQTEISHDMEELEKSNLAGATNSNQIGHLILPDRVIDVDNSQMLVGRADLKKYTKNPNMIARSHFTVYKKDGRFLIRNHVKNIQNMDERTDIFVNGNMLADDEIELKKNDKIVVSDIEMTFEV